MRTLDLDGTNNRTNVSRYAPPRYRVPAGEATIRPVLERLSRGEGPDNSKPVEPAPPVGPIHAQTAPASPKFPLSMTGRLAVAMGLIALLITVSVTFFRSAARHSASAAAADTLKTRKKTAQTSPAVDMPKIVHTVTLRPETTTVGEAGPSTDLSRSSPPPERPEAAIAGRDAAAATQPSPLHAKAALALTAPLQMWAMFPGEPSAAASNAAAAPPKVDNVNEAAPARTASVPRHRTKVTKHVRHHRRRYARHRSKRHQTRSAAAKPQQAAPAPTEASAAQPIKKMPIQVALDKIFGNSTGSATDAASGAAAPATSGAAFQ